MPLSAIRVLRSVSPGADVTGGFPTVSLRHRIRSNWR